MKPSPSTQERGPELHASGLERLIHEVGRELHEALAQVLAGLPGAPLAPLALARELGLDKVLTSRLLKAMRRSEPVSVLHCVPGPAPLRRFLHAAGRRGVGAPALARAEAAVEAFDRLVRVEVGDRSALNTVLSSWLPEARMEFETRRKQSAYRAMSELLGCSAELSLSTVFLNPSPDGARVDVVWTIGHLGLRRLRPGARVRFATRRMVADGADRRPTDLDGRPIEGLDRGRLDQFCERAPAHLDAHRYRDCVRYTLGGEAFGPASAVDLLFAEVNLREMPRPARGDGARRPFVFSEVSVPVRTLVLDALVHEDLFAEVGPQLFVYDTSLEGVADVNDGSRDMDRLELMESVQPLGRGCTSLRLGEAPNHVRVVRHVFESLGWDEQRFRAYRCRLEYPLHGCQVALAFQPPG